MLKFYYFHIGMAPKTKKKLFSKICNSYCYHSPPPLLQLCTGIIVHAQTAIQQQSNGSYEARRNVESGETSLS